MNIRNTRIIAGTGLLLLLIMVVLSTGCVNAAQAMFSEGDEDPTIPDGNDNVLDPGASGNFPAPGRAEPVQQATPSPAPALVVRDVSPYPYVTADPYRLPYRDHGNWSTTDIARVPRMPEFTKKYILRSNATAVQVDVPLGPLVVDLEFSPLFDKPDQTGDTGSSYPGEDDESDDEESSGGGVGGGSGMRTGPASFVYSCAEVKVIDTETNGTVAQEGYGCTYGSTKKQSLKVYKEGSFIIVLSGQFIDVTMKITTGSAPLKATLVPVTYHALDEDEMW